MKALILGLALGLAGGSAAGYFGRPPIEHALGGAGEVEAIVVSERQEEDRLVLTLRAGDETILASFRERASDVRELVAPGDMLTVRVGRAGVFADEVPIVRLRRAADAPVPRSRRRRGEAVGHIEEAARPADVLAAEPPPEVAAEAQTIAPPEPAVAAVPDEPPAPAEPVAAPRGRRRRTS